MRSRTLLSFLLLAGCLASGAAETYRNQVPGGGVEYSDSARPGATKVEPTTPAGSPPLRVAPPESSFAPVPVESPPGAASGYGRCAIVEPANEATLRYNSGDLPVTVALVPPLQTEFGHRVQIYLDGAPRGPARATTDVVLAAVDRGTHVLVAAVVDHEGRALVRSPPVRVYLHRHSILHPNQPKKPVPKPTK